MFISAINRINSNDRISNLKFQRNSYKPTSNQPNKVLNENNIPFKSKGNAFAFIPSSNYSISNFERSLAEKLGAKVSASNVSQFANTELYVCLPENIKKLAGNVAIIAQTIGKTVNDSIMELLFKVDAAHRAGVDNVLAVFPYMPYSRGERRVKEGESVPFKVINDMLQAVGVKGCIVGDIHSESALANANSGLVLYNVPSYDAMYEYFSHKGLKSDTTVIVSPDLGGVKRANNVANRFGCNTAAMHKIRPEHNKSVIKQLFGDVENKDVVIIDDMIDTAGTITNAAKMVKDQGAEKVYLAAGHGLFNGNAIENLNSALVDGVVVTNTMNIKPEIKEAINNFDQIDVAGYFAQKILQLLNMKKTTI